MIFERMPRQERGHDTRDTLIRAARAVFEERGYTEARVTDITGAAGAGHGTFYHYFSSKKDVFRAVASEVRDELLGAQAASYHQLGDSRQSIRYAMATYLEAFERAARIIALMEQVATYDEEIRELRLEMRRTLTRRTRRAIVAMGEAGLLGGEVDVEYVAHALGAMVDRVAYLWFVLGQDLDRERALDALTDVYTRSVLLRPSLGDERPRPSDATVGGGHGMRPSS